MSDKTLAFCIECEFTKLILGKEQQYPGPSDRTCPMCDKALWYLGFDSSPIVELLDYDECGIEGSKEYLQKLFKRVIQVLGGGLQIADILTKKEQDLLDDILGHVAYDAHEAETMNSLRQKLEGAESHH